MKKLYQTWPFNFGAIHKQDFQKAKVVIMPVPYDSTDSMVSMHCGARNGPYAIILSSRFMDELLEDKSQKKLTGLKSTDIFTLDEAVLSKNSPKEAIGGVRQAISDEIVKHNKIPLMLGGEHSITLGAVMALKEKKLKHTYLAPDIPPISKILNGLTKNVYLTVDLDVFDSSIMPSVATPEPGGLGWYEVLNLIQGAAKQKN